MASRRYYSNVYSLEMYRYLLEVDRDPDVRHDLAEASRLGPSEVRYRARRDCRVYIEIPIAEEADHG